ncbi:hypothetical protein BDW75DRAFT_241267 [Aspergillus navahoensis]
MEPPTRIPGTVLLIDAQGILNVKHGQGSREMVLVPQFTDHPEDPLRWSKSQDTSISIADLSTGNGILYLFVGWGTMITQGLALKYGRRVVLVCCIVLVTGMTLWTAFIRSTGGFFANRILPGIFASPQETLIEIVIDDIFSPTTEASTLASTAGTSFAVPFCHPWLPVTSLKFSDGNGFSIS